MKRSSISILLLAIAVASASAAGINWAKAYAGAKREAKSSDKLIMIDFYTDWCVFCKKLDAETYPAAEVVEQSVKFVPIKIDAEKDSDGIRLAKKFKIGGYPTILFLDANENLAYRIIGFESPKEFAASMEKAATAVHDRAKFEASLKQNPNDFQSLIGLASIELAIGADDKAAALADRGAKVATPEQKGAALDAFNAAADGFQTDQAFPSAISYYEKSIDANFPKQTAYARISIAVCYFSEEKPKLAIPYLEAFLKMGKEADDNREQATQMLAAAKKG